MAISALPQHPATRSFSSVLMAIKSEISSSDAFSPETKAIWEGILAPPHFGDDHPDAPQVAPTESAPRPQPPTEMVSSSTEVSSLSSAIRAGLEIYEVI